MASGHGGELLTAILFLGVMISLCLVALISLVRWIAYEATAMQWRARTELEGAPSAAPALASRGGHAPRIHWETALFVAGVAAFMLTWGGITMPGMRIAFVASSLAVMAGAVAVLRR